MDDHIESIYNTMINDIDMIKLSTYYRSTEG